MISVCREENNTITIFDNGSIMDLKVGDLLSFIGMYHLVNCESIDPKVNLDWDDNHYVIDPTSKTYGKIFENPKVFESLRNNVLALAVFLNGIALAERYWLPNDSGIASTITQESTITTRHGRDILSLIENNRDLAFTLKDSEGATTILRMAAQPSFRPSVKSDYEVAIANQNGAYRNAYMRISIEKSRRLEQNLKALAEKKFDEGFTAGMNMRAKGWEIITIGNVKFYHYPGRVNVEKIVDHDDQVHNLPPELVGCLWIEDITVPFRNIIVQASARGFNPHRSGSGYDETPEQFAQRKKLCIGDLTNQSISRLDEFIDMYKTVYMRSNYGGPAGMCCEYLLGNDGPVISLTGFSSLVKTLVKPMINPNYHGILMKTKPEHAELGHGEVFGDGDAW